MRVVIVDNFDSFTHVLAQILGGAGADVHVVRAEGDLRVLPLRPDRVVISPGPGRPEDALVASRVLDEVLGRVPVLGVCLGMQLMALREGAAVERAPEPVHGKACDVTHDGTGLFAGLESPLRAGRYHSLAVRPDSLPSTLLPTAWAGDVLMGLRHARLAAEGVQFHPESVLTPLGPRLLANFLERGGAP